MLSVSATSLSFSRRRALPVSLAVMLLLPKTSYTFHHRSNSTMRPVSTWMGNHRTSTQNEVRWCLGASAVKTSKRSRVQTTNMCKICQNVSKKEHADIISSRRVRRYSLPGPKMRVHLVSPDKGLQEGGGVTKRCLASILSLSDKTLLGQFVFTDRPRR
jgi:hypothetical protein